MNKRVMAVAAVIIMIAMLCACGNEPAPAKSTGTSAPADISAAASPAPSPSEAAATAEAVALKDGTYEYKGKKDNEVYYVEGTMVVSGGKIQSMEWRIMDAQLNRVFDASYEEVFAGNAVYIQQSKDNWSGMQTFVPALIETQDPDEVDSVSGATWAYNKFEEAAKALIEQAKQ